MNPRATAGQQASANGTAGEFIAAALFLELGYEVLWPSGSNSTPYDFIALKKGVYAKVQVKRARGADRRVSTRGGRGVKKYTASDFDLMLVVDTEWSMWLIPFAEIPPRASTLTLSHPGSRTRRSYNPDQWRIPSLKGSSNE